MAVLFNKSITLMEKMLINELGMSKTEAEDLLFELWNHISNDDDPHGTMQWFWNQFEFENDKQAEKIVGLYMPMVNSTRMLVNRGHKPTEILAKQKSGSGKKYKKCCGR